MKKLNADLFIELLQISLGTQGGLTRVLTVVEWQDIFDEAQRQAVVGLMVCGIENLPDEQRPPKELLLQWIGVVQMLEQRNKLTTKVCGEIVSQMEKDGLRCCVLKGQANHRYYPAQMSNRRSCGDIDIWAESVHGEGFTVNGSVQRVLEYVDAHWERTGLCWLHCNFTDKSGVPVEVHFHPSFFSRPKYNKRFQQYFSDLEQYVERVKIDGVEIPAMRVEEDVIYQMNHIYRHLIDEGVGLRQVVDYYYLLVQGSRLTNVESATPRQSSSKLDSVHGLNADLKVQGFDKAALMEIVSWLGMQKFAGALMYVLKELLGMPAKYLLCEPSEKDGKFLMDEILMSGNFGHQDPRMGEIAGGGYLKGRISQAWRRFKRNMRFITSYPGEVIWEPIVRVEHFVWKKLKLWKW